jgi:dCTP deaminase
MLLPDWMIRQRIKIEPFIDEQAKPGVISSGLTSYGYDLRLGRKFKVFSLFNKKTLGVFHGVVDPKDFPTDCLDEIEADYCIIPPNSFALGESMEYLEIPRSILGVCVGKSTYARCGIVANVTPLEPEWKGKVTIEISNTTPLPAKVYANEGIVQVLFLYGYDVCKRSYADKKGRYQDQQGLTLPSVN